MRNSHDTQNYPDPRLREASADDHDTLRHIAERVADSIADTGYAYVEDDKIEGLAATLGSFLTVAGIPVHPRQASGHEERAAVIEVTAAR